MRPRDVRCRKPCWIRKGSSTSSIVSRSSPIAAARLSMPTGPPANLSRTVRSSFLSITSSPERSTSSIASASIATSRVISPPARTSAKSRTRRNSRLTMRGVPRERRAISSAPAGGDFGKVAHAAQKSVDEARRAARAPRDLERARGIELDLQKPRGTGDDPGELFRRIELEACNDAEAVAQWIGEHPGASGGADQRKRRQVELEAARRRALADHDVDLEILERRVEDFLDDSGEPVDLVDEQHVVRFEVREQRGKITGALEHGPRRLPQVDAELVRDDVRQRRLAEARRAEQQHVVERFLALLRRLDENRQLAANLLLPDILVHRE